MKIVLQRVSSASVTVDGKCTGSIERGILLLVGVEPADETAQADFLADKCIHLRIFPDDNGKMNRSLLDIQGAALVVSQFTLLGDCTKGRRPSFIGAAAPDKGRTLYNHFTEKLREQLTTVQTGVFGAHMEVSLVNDGPVTLLLERT